MHDPRTIFEIVNDVINNALDQMLPPTSYLEQQMRIESAIGKILADPKWHVTIKGRTMPIVDFKVNSVYDKDTGKWHVNVDVNTLSVAEIILVNFVINEDEP